MKKVLIIEDDYEIVKLLKIHLEDQLYQVTTTDNGISGLSLGTNNDYDLILLDLALPGMDGVDVCKNLRLEKNTPVIMLTSKSEEIDRVLGLEIGADDYITKPFSIRELLARIKAVFRRTQKQDEPRANNSKLSFENLIIDIEKRKILVNDQRIELSPKEFELLVLMASNPGRNYSRSELLNMIWGYNFGGI